jgi:hypothetical protein
MSILAPVKDGLQTIWITPINHPAIAEYNVDIEVVTPFTGSPHRFLFKPLYQKLDYYGKEEANTDAQNPDVMWYRHLWQGKLGRDEIIALFEYDIETAWTDYDEVELADGRTAFVRVEQFTTYCLTARLHGISVSIHPVLDDLPLSVIDELLAVM